MTYAVTADLFDLSFVQGGLPTIALNCLRANCSILLNSASSSNTSLANKLLPISSLKF